MALAFAIGCVMHATDRHGSPRHLILVAVVMTMPDLLRLWRGAAIPLRS
jgi:hypothetical protein